MTNLRVGKCLRALAGAAVIGAGALACAATMPSAAQAETKLRITLQLPLKNILGQNLVAFKEQVEKESAGDLKVEIYDSAQLYKDKEVPQAVASGAIEMGVAALTRFAGTIPAVDLMFVPFMFNDNASIAKATAPGSPIRTKIDAEIQKTGARVLWWQAFGLAIMVSKDKPMVEPADMKNKKVRVFGKILGAFVEAAGGAPTLMSGSEQYLAYQRGTVDAGMTGVTAVKSRKLYEVMDYTTVTNHAGLEFVVLINEKVWQGLNGKQRDIVTKAARSVEKDLRERYAQIHEDTLKFIESETKMKVVRLTPAQIDAWRQVAEPAWDTYVKNAGPLGAELVEEAKKLQ
jgi:C4-dicarboxylate-binding protein DctP